MPTPVKSSGGSVRFAVFMFFFVVLAVFVLPRALKPYIPARLFAQTPRAAAFNRRFLATYYSPEENLERIDVSTIRRAHSSIEMFAYSLTDHEIIDALKYAATRGVIVCLYLDNEQTASELRRADLRDKLLDLAQTPNVTVRVKRSRVLQHTKAYVIDTWLLREGSANFSPSALKQQDNDLLLTDDADAIRAFEGSFQLAFQRPDNLTLAEFAQGEE